jgi:hypothetical protein
MALQQQTLKIAPIHEGAALRLLSALVLGWDALPPDTQLRLLRDAALMQNGFPNASVLPKTIVAFIERHKEGPSPFEGPLSAVITGARHPDLAT